MTILSLDSVSFAYDTLKILSEISFSIEEGEIVSLIGVSGSGKTTLFRLITGVIKPDSGTIDNDQNLVTYMRQEDLLLPWRTVLGNLLLFAELGKKKLKGNLETKALALLKRVGLSNCEGLFPNQLSGGMRQRVSLARALLQDRPLLLLDEPFGSLDVVIREELYTLLREIRTQFQKTILLVTHDFRDAIALSDRILILSEGAIGKEFRLTEEIRSDPIQCEEILRAIKLALTTPALR